MQSLVNRVVRGLLRTPLVSRLAGSRLITVYVVGRKSGRRYAVPVAYTRHEGDLLIGTPFGWGRNLRTGQAVAVRLKGRRRLADVRVLTEEHDVIDAYAVMARDNHNFAKFNGYQPPLNSIGADALIQRGVIPEELRPGEAVEEQRFVGDEPDAALDVEVVARQLEAEDLDGTAIGGNEAGEHCHNTPA